METFLLIVNTGSFTEAAKALFLTQPGISRRIRQLEEELHCKLFEKVGNRLLVTADGHELIPLAENVMQSVNQITRAFERKVGRFSNITIALSSTLAGTIYTERFQQLQAAFPNVEKFHMRILNDDQLSVSVLKGESDLGIRFFPDNNSKLENLVLQEDPFVLVRAAHSRWFAEDRPVTPEELREVPWLRLTKLPYFFDPITQISQLTDATLEELGLEMTQFIECYGWGVSKSLVEQDHGIVFLPSCKVRHEVECGTLRRLELPVHPTIPICGIHRRNDVHAETWRGIMEFLAGETKETTEKPTR
ncbi:MAG: LysR family transcriptional regulator [Tumebacillaceae bacterium]